MRLPDLMDSDAASILVECLEATKDSLVPQYRDDECEVRRLWDKAVAKALGWDVEELTELRLLLHQEP